MIIISWWVLLIAAVLWTAITGYAGVVVGGIVARKKSAKAAEKAALARRRVLHDAGRKYPRRHDAGAPLRIHRARISRQKAA